MSNEDQGVVVTFTPQEWVNDYAMEIDPKGEDSWTIATKEFEEITGLTLSDYEDPDEIDLDTTEGDNLKYSSTAPKWVKEHSGPFRVECNDIIATSTNQPSTKI